MAIVLCQTVHTRTSNSPVAEDDAVTTHHFAHPSSSLDDGSMDDLVGLLNTFWAASASIRSNDYTALEHRFYELPETPGTLGAPFQVSAGTGNGTSAVNSLPPQVALSITERTTERKRWGRFYVPGLPTDSVLPDGRVVTARVDTFANAFGTFCNGCYGMTVPMAPVVFSRALWVDFAIVTVQVDNTFDIIRSRRWDTTTYRNEQPVIIP